MVPEPNLNLVVIFESENPVEIGLARAALEEAGIECAVTSEPQAGFGFGPLLNPTSRIQVAASSAAQAGEIVEGLFGGEMEAAERVNELADE